MDISPRGFLISKLAWTKALFIWAKTPHLPDPALTGEVNFSDCLHEIFHLTCQPQAER